MNIKLKIATTVHLFVFVLFSPGATQIVTAQTAMTENQRRLYELELGYFADLACPPSDSTNSIYSAPTSLVGSDNQEKSLNYFISKGLTKEQSAGIIGNLMRESNLNPYADQANGPGMGIAQWSEGGRWDVLLSWAGGRDPYGLDTQLDFIWYEMTTVSPWNLTLPAIKATATVEEAAAVFEDKFEKSADTPGSSGMALRIKYALDAYTSIGGVVESNPSAPAPLPTTFASDFCGTYGYGTNVGITAAASQFIDGIEIFSQTDPLWKDIVYGTSTIGAAGCGVTAMATIISALTGIRTTPPETAAYADEQNQFEDGVGSKWTMPPIVAEKWGLNARQINPTIADVTAILNMGGMVITSGKGPLPFSTTTGHYIAIRAVTPEGKWMVADSSHGGVTNTVEYDPQFILNIIIDSERSGSMYGITPKGATATPNTPI